METLRLGISEQEREMCMRNFPWPGFLILIVFEAFDCAVPFGKKRVYNVIIQSSYVHHVMRLLYRRSIQLSHSCNVQFLGYCTLYCYQTNVLLLYNYHIRQRNITRLSYDYHTVASYRFIIRQHMFIIHYQTAITRYHVPLPNTIGPHDIGIRLEHYRSSRWHTL